MKSDISKFQMRKLRQKIINTHNEVTQKKDKFMYLVTESLELCCVH